MNPLAHIQITPGRLAEPIDQDSVGLGCSIPRRSAEPLNFGLPLILRDITSDQVGEAWEAFATLMHRLEIPVRSPATAWSNFSGERPLSLNWCSADKGVQPEAVQDADLFEIDLRTSNRQAWGTRPELSSSATFTAMVDTLRLVGGPKTIGATIPAGASPDDIELVCQSNVDFVTVVERSQLSLLGLSTLRAVKEVGGDRHLAVILDTTVESHDDIVKCIGLGASAVTLDSLLRPILKRNEKKSDIASGMLSGIAVSDSPAKSLLRDVTLTISSIRGRLEEALGLTGCQSLAEFNHNHLVATNADVARIAAVPLLGA